jgi:gliding motility-associated-like protein
MTPNKGQWDERILFNVDLNHGKLYIENHGMTFYLSDALVHNHHDKSHDHEGIKYHVIKQTFIGSNWKGNAIVSDSSQTYKNFILGNDQSNWKSLIFDYKNVRVPNFYEGIDLIYSGDNGQLSYNFEVSPNSKAEQINFNFEGGDHNYIDENGILHIKHRFGEIIQSAPRAWTIDEQGVRKKVEVKFKERNNIISFHFPRGYDKSKTLFIDPSLTFSTFTGSAADNWGFTATPDPNGNLFGGGIVFASGYPTSVGAFDVSYNGGTGILPFDVGITKYNATGNQLLYSTFLGGSGNEAPHSIVCAPNGELYIYGTTSSSNFPMAGTPYDNSFNGGPNLSENSLEYNGSDIYVARLNANGTNLIASTYIGGSNTDGLSTNSLHYNYGDQFRGEITLDDNQNVYVSSTTESSNFPTVNALQNFLNGDQDAIVFRMNSNLSALTWSTYFGGTGNETGNALTLGSNSSVYFVGGTTSSSLPISSGNDLTFNGGMSDGYLVRLNATTGAMQAGTFIGLNEYDQTYFVQTDIDNKVYVYGQTESNWPITPGCYGTANSGQFIRKYDSDLMNINWTTMIGGGSGHVEISPTAFLVSDCYDIYLAGWGGALNQNDQATNSTTYGFQCTPDGFQVTTNGSNFYIAVLDQDASALKYATFMGGIGTSSSFSYNHVDGGTSRFDKSGRIYHAVCGACGGNPNGFTSTPGSWSPTNNSSNCNMATFKFELSSIEAAAAQPEPLICIPQLVYFQNNSVNGNSYYWDFGDGNTSTEFEPSHQYTTPGVYEVELVVSDSTGCFSADSVSVIVNIGAFEGNVTTPSSPICPGDSYQFDAFGGSTYSWSPANLLDNPSISNPTATIFQTTIFTVTISDSCGSSTNQVTLDVIDNELEISQDTNVCIGNSVSLFANGNGNIFWEPATYLNNTSIPNPISTPDSMITYTATLTSPEGCVKKDSVTISVFQNPPIPILADTLAMCKGSMLDIVISGGTTYDWSPNTYILDPIGAQVTVFPPTDQWYYSLVTNACGSKLDSVFVMVTTAEITAGNDTTICPNDKATLWANGGTSYLWYPNNFVESAYDNTAIVKPATSTIFYVVGTDSVGCKDTATVEVNVLPYPSLQVSSDVVAFYDDEIQLNAMTHVPGALTWSPPEFLSCVNCPNPIATPNTDITYFVEFIDANGCVAKDYVNISYRPAIYVPNTFIPDGNNVNEVFKIYGGNIKEMECEIFNRWGELIYTLNSVNDFWDGTYKGKICQDGTYTWKLNFQDFQYRKYQLTGHVNLLR